MVSVVTCGTVHQLKHQRTTGHNAGTTGKEIPVAGKDGGGRWSVKEDD